ncbi:MAG: hypothetical protein R3A79_25220 [Nannocystaceae bacterium]
MVGAGRRRRPAGVALVAGALLVAPLLACAAKVHESDMRAVWVPREGSHGLVIDEASSDVHRIYAPREETRRRGGEGVGAASSSAQK